MAVYFAQVTMQTGNLYDDLVTHYATVPSTVTVPTLLPPIPNAVAWLRLEGTGAAILGTLDVSPFFGPVVLLDTPVEIPGGGGRNTINLSGIMIEPVGVVIDIAFAVI